MMDEVRNSTSQKGDGAVGGKMFVCGKGMAPKEKCTTKLNFNYAENCVVDIIFLDHEGLLPHVLALNFFSVGLWTLA